ncbi:DsbA family oxidoreductase [uncultured Cellulomonas sp.]|uniref:DsbA family oxidoreductase n=1 Tax=uncultured Cellulomonas sp. TaxID=189682 RepID=UPI0028EBB497|nr:DsbA family oxidoreductase [uncultured Cellulomonas sp.]
MTIPTLNTVRTLQVEVWSDIACPWCYIGKRRFATALADFPHRQHVQVTWRSYELSPRTPVGPGRPEIDMLAALKGIPHSQVKQMFAQVTAVAAGEGLAYDFDRALAVNTFAAHRLVHVARTTGGPELAERVLETLFSAHFEHGADLGDEGTLVDLVSSAGLDAATARAALAGDDGAEAVRADEDEARALGVTGVPFFVVDRRVAVSGAQPADVFTQLLEAGWREANPLQTLASADPDAAACVDDSCAI